MSLKCTVRKVVLIKQMPIFILVQLGLKGKNESRSLPEMNKFRTQLSLDTPRPKFHNNEFIFTLRSQQHQQTNNNNNTLTGQQVYSLKFGLMLMPIDTYGKIISQDYNKAKPIALTSVSLSLVRLKQNGTKPEIKFFEMVDNRGKVYAQFECVLEYFENVISNRQYQQKKLQSQNKKDQSLKGEDYSINNNINDNNNDNNMNDFSQSRVLYDPLISWMMYDQNCNDPLRQNNCIKALQQQSNLLFNKYHKSKTQQQQYQTLLNQLQQDEKQLLQELQMYQKVNNKISEKLNQKQSLQGLKLQIDMLKGSRQGRQLLLDKIEYFQDRIMKEQQMYGDLVKQYKQLKPQIQRKLKQGQQIGSKLKGKQQQQFQINNNTQILKNYQQTLYEYKSNQQVIQSLIKLSKKSTTSEYTRQQAQLFLSQVKYEIKLQELNLQKKTKGNQYGGGDNKEQDYQLKLLGMIQEEMRGAHIARQIGYQQIAYNNNNNSNSNSNSNSRAKSSSNNNNNKQQLQFVLRIKLDSLLQQTQKIKSRINKLKDKQQMAAQFNYNNHVNSINHHNNGINNNSSGLMNKSLMSTR